jgi:hypothetical protein
MSAFAALETSGNLAMGNSVALDFLGIDFPRIRVGRKAHRQSRKLGLACLRGWASGPRSCGSLKGQRTGVGGVRPTQPIAAAIFKRIMAPKGEGVRSSAGLAVFSGIR